MRAPVSVKSAPGTLRTVGISVFIVAVAAVLPPLLMSGYSLDVASEILIFAIAAISLDLLLGYGGMVSFGHAAFFGLGAYGTVLLNVHHGWDPWAAMLGGTVIAAIVAALIGAFCVRMSGVGFFMMTLAFSQLLYSGAVKWRFLTGGSDGVGFLPRPEIFGISAADQRVMYLLTLGCLVLAFFALRVLIGSQFGHALVGSRENEMRMSALGYDVRKLRLLTFTISGTVAGFGGGIYAFFNGFVSPDALSWGISGMLLLMVVLGGKGTLVGSIIGSAIFLLVKNFVSSHTEHWQLIVGGTFVICVMFFPEGIYGLRRWSRSRR
jgi:branched-chain amino acid transport system permease protein